MKEIREPKQKRSIEKKNKIIKAGYQLFCEKGYYNTNTAEIAKRAGVSTGIVYNYFTDKKDILISVLGFMKITVQDGIDQSLKALRPSMDLSEAINEIIDIALAIHISTSKLHEEFIAIAHLDEDVNDYFKKIDEILIEQLVNTLKIHDFHIDHPHEKLHVAYNLVEDYCHETVYHNHNCIQPEVMKRIIIDAIVHILK